jgi:hypothetical protein
LVAGESVVVIGPGPIGLLAVAVAKALGASPVILTGTRNGRLAIGRELGADRAVNINDEDAVEVVKQLTGGIGADYVVECAGTEVTINRAIHMNQSWRENLPRRASARSGHDGPRASRKEQHLRLRNSWRRPFGSRFSMNALTPSCMSCVLNSGRNYIRPKAVRII